MSDTSAATRVGGVPELLPRSIIEIPDAMFADGKSVEPMNKQTSKAWYGVAIAVGIVAVLGGVFGGLGLLQAHYHFLPGSFDWLAKAVECVGNLGPHNAVLWALAGAGVLGLGAIAGGSYKVHKAGMEDQRIEQEKIALMKSVKQSLTEHTDKFPARKAETTATDGTDVGSVKLAKDAPNRFAFANPDMKKQPKTVDEISLNPKLGKVRSDDVKKQNRQSLALEPKVTEVLAEKQKALEAKRALAEEQMQKKTQSPEGLPGPTFNSHGGS